jgi:hypothetical protein
VRVLQAQAQQVERLRYEAALAERQFRRVDPDNRLVAAELEQRWELALRAVKQAEETAVQVQDATARAPVALDPSVRAALVDLGQHLPTLWDAGVLSRAQKKALLRCLIDKVVLHRSVPDSIHARIVWRGGDTSTFEIPIAVGSLDRLTCAHELEEHVLAGHAAGATDAEIAQRLTEHGYRSPRREVVLESTVRRIRLKQRLFLERPSVQPGRPEGYLAISQVAELHGVSQQWLYYRIYAGQINLPRDETTNRYLFPDHPDTFAQLHQLKTGTCKVVHLDRGHHHA